MRDRAGGSRRNLSAVPQLVRPGHRPGTGDRAPCHYRLSRNDSRLFRSGCRNGHARPSPGPDGNHGNGRRTATRECSRMTRSAAAAPTAMTSPGAAAGVKPRLLVVDDEPSMREMLRIVLKRDGYDVVLAANGAEAIDILRCERVDLLLSDIRMPDVSGVEVLRSAREANRDLVA